MTATSFATGKAEGPAGSGIDVSSFHFGAPCATAYFFFDGARIGSGPVDAAGNAHAKGISIPGTATTGSHQITGSCQPTGKKVEAATGFRVTKASTHRSELLTSLAEPRQVPWSARRAAEAGGAAILLMLLLAFPSQLFNATLDENYEEVRGWFGFIRPLSEVVTKVNQRLMLPLFLILGGVLYALLSPDVGLNLSSLALVLGLVVALAFMAVGFALPTLAYFRLRFRDHGQLLVMPGTLLVAAVCIAASRLAHFQPGYLYGVLMVFVFQNEIDERGRGRLAAASGLFVLGLAMIAWFAWVPVSGASMGSGAGFWSILAESALSGAFLIGLEATLVNLLPLRFLDGQKIFAWSRVVWGALFSLALFVLIYVLLQPGTGYVHHTGQASFIGAVVLFVAFGLFSILFWSYFRFRRGGALAEGDLAAEGEFDVR